jgi:hypothetical protein
MIAPSRPIFNYFQHDNLNFAGGFVKPEGTATGYKIGDGLELDSDSERVILSI